MLLVEKFLQDKDLETCYYYSLKKDERDLYKIPNVIKTNYYPTKSVLYVFFLKERKNYRKEKEYQITVYVFNHVDNMLYESYKKADSQSDFHKRFITNNTAINIIGKTQLYRSEVDEILNEWYDHTVKEKINLRD